MIVMIMRKDNCWSQLEILIMFVALLKIIFFVIVRKLSRLSYRIVQDWIFLINLSYLAIISDQNLQSDVILFYAIVDIYDPLSSNFFLFLCRFKQVGKDEYFKLDLSLLKWWDFYIDSMYFIDFYIFYFLL